MAAAAGGTKGGGKERDAAREGEGESVHQPTERGLSPLLLSVSLCLSVFVYSYLRRCSFPSV